MIPLSCLRLLQRCDAVGLGRRFAQSFATNTAGLGNGEVVLFRAMQRSLQSMTNPPRVIVEEYHGSSHQVTFKGTGTYSRTNARCELSDLLVIVYDRQTKDARLSYVQAKSERAIRPKRSGIAGHLLAANLEQWDLLARRPLVKGVGNFAPPKNLLKSAPLASVGSFVFFLHGRRGVEIQYSAASYLSLPHHYRSRYGKLRVAPDQCRCRPAQECLSVYGNSKFGAFLFGLMIGTPVLSSGKSASGMGVWLAAQLRGLARDSSGADVGAELANELARLLDPNDGPPAYSPNVGATTLMVVGIGGAPGRGDN